MAARQLTLMGVGDLMLGKPDAASFFALAAPTLQTADVLVGQGEVPFTLRSVAKYYVQVPTEMPGFYETYDPANIGALASAGFNVITLASNHIWDSGVPGIEDTIAGLRQYGIAFTGAGMNIDEARRPAIIERRGTAFGFLDYNCVGPKLTWATPDKPGCAYVHVVVAYELEHPTPGGTPTIYALAEPRSLAAMADDIRRLWPLCDVLVVCFHKGLGFSEARLAMYEPQVACAAIDAGADLVLAHHAHILKGIEFYKGKAVFHGLGNFVSVLPNLTPTPAQKEFEKKYKEQLSPHFDSDQEWMYTYAPETMYSMIARCTIEGGAISRVSYLPCLINRQGQPEVLGNDARGRQIFDYVDKITRAADLNARYEWAGDEVVVRPG
jgi:poly-gamma-glutamate capsule biosynthesis protein CapA/YwtB (metallophosphatase superfamily)